MHIVLIGWLFVLTLMSLTETSVVAGLATFLFGGVLPVAILMYLGGAKARRQKREAAERRDNLPE